MPNWANCRLYSVEVSWRFLPLKFTLKFMLSKVIVLHIVRFIRRIGPKWTLDEDCSLCGPFGRSTAQWRGVLPLWFEGLQLRCSKWHVRRSSNPEAAKQVRIFKLKLSSAGFQTREVLTWSSWRGLATGSFAGLNYRPPPRKPITEKSEAKNVTTERYPLDTIQGASVRVRWPNAWHLCSPKVWGYYANDRVKSYSYWVPKR